ncbi:hypothetical protein QBC44DRAFT_15935 [Cladorrhinum sp. PSN332]|nr:hypothetical protein QBC44DRAFT_15935 [Cladorrhinum sp. PSN332]
MPDLNSVPASPHFLASSSRQSSQNMTPSSPSLNILPSNQEVVNHPTSSIALPSPQFRPIGHVPGSAMGDNTGVGHGPGPQRLPRPPTASEIHSQLEKEQEAVVNRLNRELSLLQTAHASVFSTTSSISATATEPVPPLETYRGRHQRTASNTSTSTRSNVGSVSTPGISSPLPVRPGQNAGLPATLAEVARQRRASTASRRSRTGSPAPFEQPGYFGSVPRVSASTSVLATPGDTDSSSVILPATPRLEEAMYYREQMNNARAENEILKQRLRELENLLRQRRESDASISTAGGANVLPAARSGSRPRSDSVSTTTSVAASVSTSATGAGGISVAAQRDRPRVVSQISSPSIVGVGVPEDEVRVGESASSSGLANPGSQR